MKSEYLSLKTIINELHFLKKQLLFNEASKKDLQLFVIKLTEKIPDPHHAKERYQSFIKITKLVKQSKIITYQPTTFETQALLI